MIRALMSVMSRPRQVDLSCFLQAILGCISAQCGRQEAWTTVDLALIRGLVPHDQGSSRGFLCLADVRRLWSTLFVGLDVHKKTISVAMVEATAGAEVRFSGP